MKTQRKVTNMDSKYVNYAELSNEYDGQEIHHPSLNDITKIITSINGKSFTTVSLDKINYTEEGMLGEPSANSLTIRGGLKNKYKVVFHPVQDWYYVVGPGSPDGWADCYEVHEDGSSGLVRGDLIVDLSTALKVARYFAQYGEQHPEYEFKKVDHDEIYEGRRKYLESKNSST